MSLHSILHVHERSAYFQERELAKEFSENAKRVIEMYDANGQRECVYTVPSFQLGKCAYDIVKVTKRVVHRLRRLGFKCRGYTDGSIRISWSKLKERMLKEKYKEWCREREEREAGMDDPDATTSSLVSGEERQSLFAKYNMSDLDCLSRF